MAVITGEEVVIKKLPTRKQKPKKSKNISKKLKMPTERSLANITYDDGVKVKAGDLALKQIMFNFNKFN